MQEAFKPGGPEKIMSPRNKRPNPVKIGFKDLIPSQQLSSQKSSSSRSISVNAKPERTGSTAQSQ